MFDASPIIRLNGAINKIEDTLIGGVPDFAATGSQVSGQLGQTFALTDSQLIYDSAMGTVYGGLFQYVRLAAAAGAPAVGQGLFWDVSVAPNLYQVTTVESGSADGAMQLAGINLNSGLSAGNYGVIQLSGLCYVKFRAVLTAAGAAGSRVFAAGAGAGADLGEFDVIDSGAAAVFSDVSKMLGRYAGVAFEAPANDSLKRVWLNIHNLR